MKFLNTEIAEAYTFFNDTLEFIIENWGLVLALVSSPVFLIYVLKLLVLYIGNKKGKQVLNLMIDNFWNKIDAVLKTNFSNINNLINDNEKILENKIKLLENKVETFNKVILNQKENANLKADYEKIILNNKKHLSQIEQIKKETKAKVEETKNELKKTSTDLKGTAKKLTEKNIKQANKKIEKISNKIDKELINNDKINLA